MAKAKTVFAELCKLFDIEPKKNEDNQAFLKRFMKHADGELDGNDKLWAKMSEDAQNWYNEAVDAMEEKKAVPLPDGLAGGDDDDEDSAPKRKGAKAGKAAKPDKAEKVGKKGKRAKADEDEDSDEDEGPKRKKAKAGKEKANGKGRSKGNGIKRERRFTDSQKITLLVKENPKREGTASYERFDAYFDKKVKTVGDALAKGITLGDLAWDSDEKRNYIRIG